MLRQILIDGRDQDTKVITFCRRVIGFLGITDLVQLPGVSLIHKQMLN